MLRRRLKKTGGAFVRQFLFPPGINGMTEILTMIREDTFSFDGFPPDCLYPGNLRRSIPPIEPSGILCGINPPEQREPRGLAKP